MIRLIPGPPSLSSLVVAALVAVAAAPAVALDDDAAANRLVVEAARLVEGARDAVEPARRLELLTRAHDNLKAVVERHAGSGLAVTLATGQSIGTLSLGTVAEARSLAEGEACLAAPTSDCLFALSVSIAEALGEVGDRDRALGGIVDGWIAAGRFAAALETAKAIADSDDRTWNIIAVLKAQADAGDAAGADRTVREALAAGPDAFSGGSPALMAIAEQQGKLGDAAGALATARAIADNFWRSKAMSLIATAQAAAGDAAGAEATLSVALELALETAADDRSRITFPVAEARAAIGDVDGAIALARSMPEPERRNSTLIGIAEAEIEAGNPATARALLAALVEDVEARAGDEAGDGTLSSAVYKLVQADDPVRALQAARAISADAERFELVVFAAGALARAGKPASAAEALSGLPEAAAAIADAGARADALTALAGAEIEAKDTGAAARTLRAAMAAASAIADDEERRWDLIDIAELYARAGDAERAHDAAGRIPDLQWRTNAYFAIARKQAETGDRLGAAETRAVALRAAHDIPEDFRRNQAIGRASFEHIEAGDLAGALEAARPVADDWERAGVLRYIAEKWGETGDVAGAKEILLEARDAVRAGAETYVSASLPRLIAETYAGLGDTPEALETARDIADEGERAEALRAIARLRAEAGDAEGAKITLFEALRTTAAIEDDDRRAGALAAAAQLAGLGQ